MKRSLPYEIAAAIMALLGAFILVCVYFPLLNPGMHKVETGHQGEPLGYYLVLTPIPLLILVASWRCNRKAQSLKLEERDADAQKDKDKKPSASYEGSDVKR